MKCKSPGHLASDCRLSTSGSSPHQLQSGSALSSSQCPSVSPAWVFPEFPNRKKSEDDHKKISDWVESPKSSIKSSLRNKTMLSSQTEWLGRKSEGGHRDTYDQMEENCFLGSPAEALWEGLQRQLEGLCGQKCSFFSLIRLNNVFGKLTTQQQVLEGLLRWMEQISPSVAE